MDGVLYNNLRIIEYNSEKSPTDCLGRNKVVTPFGGRHPGRCGSEMKHDWSAKLTVLVPCSITLHKL